MASVGIIGAGRIGQAMAQIALRAGRQVVIANSRGPESLTATVEALALQGTHDGPLALPQGILPPTGNRMDAPCCDVFRLENGRIQLFDCYPSGTVILGQLGVLGNLGAVLQQPASR
jgi:NAD(P)-dependent dehydrogenase (short-subunit alcohol dehydrogenase family)